MVIIGDSFVAAGHPPRPCASSLHVTVLVPRVPLAKRSDTVGRAIRARHEAHGVVFHLPRSNAVQIRRTGLRSAVRLDNDQRLAADLVLVIGGQRQPLRPLPGYRRSRITRCMSMAQCAAERPLGGWRYATFPLNSKYLRIELATGPAAGADRRSNMLG